MALYPIPDPLMKCEESIVAYLSSSLAGYYDSAYSNVQYHTGVSSEDKEGTNLVIVNGASCNEVYYGSRVYAFDVDIIILQMAYDFTRTQFQTFVGNIKSLLTGQKTSSDGINTYATGFRSFQVQIINHNNNHSEDAWSSTLTIRVIGCLT